MEVVNYIEIMVYVDDYWIMIRVMNKWFKWLLCLNVYMSMTLYIGVYIVGKRQALMDLKPQLSQVTQKYVYLGTLEYIYAYGFIYVSMDVYEES